MAAPVAALEADEVSLVAVNAWAPPVRAGDEMQSWQPRMQLRHPLAEIDTEVPPVETSNKVKAPVAAQKVGEASHSKWMLGHPRECW